MDVDIIYIFYSALLIGFIHTIIGVDHYLPIISISKSEKWNLKKTVLFTLCCGSFHLFTALIIIIPAILLESFAKKVNLLTSTQSKISSWILISIGAIYLIKSLFKKLKLSITNYSTNQNHFLSKFPAILIFLFFAIGPCESLIPLLLYPASNNSFTVKLIIFFLFSLSTLLTMTLLISCSFIKIKQVLYVKKIVSTDFIAGITIISCGILLLLGII